MGAFDIDAAGSYSPDELYNALAYAETGSSNFDNPWIRTVASGVEGGSNAFGPVQMLSNLVGNVPMTREGKPMINYTDDELNFIEKYKQQGTDFYKHGNMQGEDPSAQNYLEDYDPRFDYGGEGLGFSDTDKGLYESVAKKIMNYEYGSTRAGGDINKFIQSWRGKTEEEDPDYYDKVRGELFKGDVVNPGYEKAFVK